MNNIRLIKLINNINMADKYKTKEQYEIIINVSLQEIERLELCIILQEETINKYYDVEFNPKKFIGYLENGYYRDYEYSKYMKYQELEEELENIYNVDDTESEEYYYCKDTELTKQEINKTKRKIHQEKFKMCIHKLKMSLPDSLICEVGNYL